MRRVEIGSRIIAFNRAYVALTGSVTAALMLSQAVYWQLRREEIPDGEWWWKTRDEWSDEIGLSRREQETARKSLRSFAWWQEEERGLPSRLWFRVDLVALEQALADMKGGNEPGSRAESAQQQGRKAPNIQSGKITPKTTSEITPEKIPPTPQGAVVSLPEVLDTDAFRQALADFEADRKERRKPMTSRARSLLIEKAASWGHDKAIEAIKESISNGWAGVFEPKANGSKPSAASREKPQAEKDYSKGWDD